MENTPLMSPLLFLIGTISSIGSYVWVSLALAAVFRKLGEKGWKAWVPVYGTITFFKLGRQNPWWLLTYLVPGVSIVGFVFYIRAIHQINRHFSKGKGFTFLGVVLFAIWASIVGFGSAVAIDPDAKPVYKPVTKIPYGAPPIAQPPKASVATSTPPAPISAPPFAPPPPPPPPAGPPAPPAVISAAPGFPPPPPPAPSALAPSGPPPPAANPFAHSAPGTVPAAYAPPPAPAVPAAPAAPATFGAPPAPAPAPATFAAPPAPANYAAPPAPPISLEPAAESSEIGEHTVVVNRRAKVWVLSTDDGQNICLTQQVALLGRNPTADRAFPDAQLVPLNDTAKTVSKTHARIELTNGAWQITDLDSTNGVVTLEGSDETELQSGVATALTERFLLGELPVSIQQEASA